LYYINNHQKNHTDSLLSFCLLLLCHQNLPKYSRTHIPFSPESPIISHLLLVAFTLPSMLWTNWDFHLLLPSFSRTHDFVSLSVHSTIFYYLFIQLVNLFIHMHSTIFYISSQLLAPLAFDLSTFFRPPTCLSGSLPSCMRLSGMNNPGPCPWG
jgi:hypothetical protein